MKTLLDIIPKMSYHSNGLFNQVYLICILSIFAIITKVFKIKVRLPVTFFVNGEKIKFYLYYFSDIGILKEILVDNEYDWFPIKNPKRILDLGAHFGDTTVYYAAYFPDAKIIAVEPSLKNFQRLKENTSSIKNIVCENIAVGESDTTAKFFLTKNSAGHSLKPRVGATSIDLDVISLESLFLKHNIEKVDMIKFDIEGAEFDLFKNIKPEKFATFYIGEIHEDLSGKKVDDFKEYFASFSEVTITPLPKTGRYSFRASL